MFVFKDNFKVEVWIGVWNNGVYVKGIVKELNIIVNLFYWFSCYSLFFFEVEFYWLILVSI